MSRLTKVAVARALTGSSQGHGAGLVERSLRVVVLRDDVTSSRLYA